MTSSPKALTMVVLVAIPMTMLLGLVLGLHSQDLLPALRSPFGQRAFHATLGALSTISLTTLAVLFCLRPRFQSWLPPFVLFGAALGVRDPIEPHQVVIGLIGISWLLTLVLRSPRLAPLRIAATVACGASIVALHVCVALAADQPPVQTLRAQNDLIHSV